MSPEQAILTLGQLGEIFARSKDDKEALAISSIIFAIMGSFHDGSLLQLSEITRDHIRKRLDIYNGVKSNSESFNPQTYIPDMPCMN